MNVFDVFAVFLGGSTGHEDTSAFFFFIIRPEESIFANTACTDVEI